MRMFSIGSHDLDPFAFSIIVGVAFSLLKGVWRHKRERG